MKPNQEPNIRKQVKLNPSDSEPSENDNQLMPNLVEAEEALHSELRDFDNEAVLYGFIQELCNIDQETPIVDYPNLINFINYPNLSKTILDSVRSGGKNLTINDNNLTVNSVNIILQEILDGLNSPNPQFQELECLQISSNVSNMGNVAMNEESMNLLSDIMLHPNSQIRTLDIRNNNIDPNHLNIFLERNVGNQNLLELDFSFNLINQDSVELLNSIFENNPNIEIDGDYSLPQSIELGILATQPRLGITSESEEIFVNRLTPSTSPGLSRTNSLNSLNSHQL